jgi:hypothetical protein
VALSPNDRRKREAIDRRRQVANLRLTGNHDQTAIAKMLGVSQPTISRDFAALDAEFQQRAAEEVATHKGLDLVRIETLIQGLWPLARRGDDVAVREVHRLLNRKAKMLGLDAPKRVETSHEVTLRTFAETLVQGSDISPDEVVEEAMRLLREHAT